MHQKHARFGFDVCAGDRAAAAGLTFAHRALLPPAVDFAPVSYRDRLFETKIIVLPPVYIAPITPPPRLG